jgi:tetratricopeptide (TPR) repeat protein
LEPNCVRARDWYGLSLDRLDDNEGAVEEYLRVLELDPDRHATRLRLAEFYLSQRRFTDALPHLEHLLALQKDRPEVLTGLARVRLGLGDPDAARGFLERATTAEPDYLPALTLRGRLELETGHPAAAVPWLRRALKADPSGVEANYALYQCLTLEHGAEAEAREQLTRYQRAKADNDRLGELLRSKLSAAPGNPDLPCEVGQILLRMGQPTQALYWLNRALKLDPNHAGAHATLASYFESVGDVQQAGKHRVSSATR